MERLIETASEMGIALLAGAGFLLVFALIFGISVLIISAWNRCHPKNVTLKSAMNVALTIGYSGIFLLFYFT